MVLKIYSDPVVFATKYAVYGPNGEVSGRVFVLDEAAQKLQAAAVEKLSDGSPASFTEAEWLALHDEEIGASHLTVHERPERFTSADDLP